jgi:twitching motility two-component system response regulator PilH
MAKTVLVVDDSQAHLKMMQAAVQGRGYEVLTAVDGEEALAQASAHHPDVILLDIVLPKKNGFQVCRQLKAQPETSGIKIIMVSSKDQESDRYWGLKQGADGYITKPYQPQELLAAVERAI